MTRNEVCEIVSSSFQSSGGESESRVMTMQKLYPLSHAIGHVLHSNERERDPNLDCFENSASFVGEVGLGNRSVQSVIAFPSIPVCRKSPQSLFVTLKKASSELFTTALGLLICGNRWNRRQRNQFARKGTGGVAPISGFSISDTTQIFCTPFAVRLTEENEISKRYYLLPRFVAYYEVIVSKKSEYTTDDRNIRSTRDVNNSAECVAVGLARKGFTSQKRLPGWDDDSYGYHSDDGAIFHGRGRQLATFGPSFGAGDIVGCGLDYSDFTIFFTLNGHFLGTAFTLDRLLMEGVDTDTDIGGGGSVTGGIDLYPTVGIDAAASVLFNFGREPFAFDLVRYCAKREREVAMLR